MYQTLHEEVSVAGIFSRGKFIPKRFKWKYRDFTISEVTLVSDSKDGGVRKRWFSVLTQDKNVFRLVFNQENYHWWVEEVWIDG